MDTTYPLEQFLLKSEIEERYGRARRTLTGDITKAIRTKDSELLTLLRVRTNDDQIREGTTIEPGQVKRLEAAGKQPEWLVHPEFVSIAQKRSSRRQKQKASSVVSVPPFSSEVKQDSDPSAAVAPASNDEAEEVESASTGVDAEDKFVYESPEDVISHLPEGESRGAVAEALLREKQVQLIALNQKYEDVRSDAEDNRTLLKKIAERLNSGGELNVIAMGSTQHESTLSKAQPKASKQEPFVEASVVEPIKQDEPSSTEATEKPRSESTIEPESVGEPERASTTKPKSKKSTAKKTTRPQSAKPKKSTSKNKPAKKPSSGKNDAFPTFRRFANYVRGK